MKRSLPVLLLVLAVIYGLVAAAPAWQAATGVKHGRDYATYHYAVIEAVSPGVPGQGDPYDTAALGSRASAEGTRRQVHPYFYPPPFLLGMLWVTPPGLPPLSLDTGVKAWFLLNQACLLGVLWTLWRWFRAHPLLLAAIAIGLTPVADNAKMGQANIAVLLLAVLGLWRGSGALVGAAAMAKMAPVLYLAPWAAQRRLRPLVAAVGAAVVLSLVALPLVPLPTQLRFYTEILPGFSSGDYHGLVIPITLPANHSIPDFFNQLWPGPDDHTLSVAARSASQAISLVLLAGLGWLGRRPRDPLGQANLAGALTVLMLLTPVYAYEHHLAMMILPLAALGQALLVGRLPAAAWALAAPAAFFVGWKLLWLRQVQQALPELHWWLQESKPLGMAVVGLLCAWAVTRSPEA